MVVRFKMPPRLTLTLPDEEEDMQQAAADLMSATAEEVYNGLKDSVGRSISRLDEESLLKLEDAAQAKGCTAEEYVLGECIRIAFFYIGCRTSIGILEHDEPPPEDDPEEKENIAAPELSATLTDLSDLIRERLTAEIFRKTVTFTEIAIEQQFPNDYEHLPDLP